MELTATTLDEAKELLYGQPLDAFVSERNVLVKAIRAGGDRELANEVKTLRKPSAVAAEVNHVVRADPAGIELILQAAELLRAAQSGALEGSDIDASALQQQYRAAISALAQTAPSRKSEVRAALEAATIDEASNDDLRRGCLVAVPTPVSIFGISPPAPTPPSGRADAAETADDSPVDELEARRAQRAAKKEAAKKDASKKDAAKEDAAGESAAEVEERARAEEEEERQAQEAEAAADQEAEAAELEAQAARLEAEKAAAKAEAAARKAEAAAAKKAEAKRKAEARVKRKELKAAHRKAVRVHLAALDAEASAVAAVEDIDNALAEADDEIEALERSLEETRTERAGLVDQRAEQEGRSLAAAAEAVDAQTAVDELAAQLEALE